MDKLFNYSIYYNTCTYIYFKKKKKKKKKKRNLSGNSYSHFPSEIVYIKNLKELYEFYSIYIYI